MKTLIAFFLFCSLYSKAQTVTHSGTVYQVKELTNKRVDSVSFFNSDGWRVADTSELRSVFNQLYKSRPDQFHFVSSVIHKETKDLTGTDAYIFVKSKNGDFVKSLSEQQYANILLLKKL